MEKMDYKRLSLWISFVKWENNLSKSTLLRGVIFLIVLLAIGGDVNAQTQTKRFRIVSFTINGVEVTNFDVFFLIDGKCIKPNRTGNIIFVPPEVQQTASTSSGIRFVGSNFDFTFSNLAFKGYEDSDEVKSDYIIEVSTDPLEIKRQLDQMSDKSKHGLGIRNSRDICTVLSLTRLPTLRQDSKLIADPVTITKVVWCKNLGKTSRNDKKVGSNLAFAKIIVEKSKLMSQSNSNSKIIREVTLGERLVLVSDEPVGIWYPVRDSKTNSQGWLNSNHFKIIKVKKLVNKQKKAKK
jgi:hypothetical protein